MPFIAYAFSISYPPSYNQTQEMSTLSPMIFLMPSLCKALLLPYPLPVETDLPAEVISLRPRISPGRLLERAAR